MHLQVERVYIQLIQVAHYLLFYFAMPTLVKHIPVIIQSARFRVLEQFQFEARQLNHGIPYFFGATIKWDCSSASPMGLKTIYTALLILTREQPFSAINTLFKSFFSPTETCTLNGHGYIPIELTISYLTILALQLVVEYLLA